jgi:predicted DNA-binding transcriptional regulator YafY
LITLEVIFYNGAGNHLFETPLSSDQTLTDQVDGTVRLVATVPHTLQLGWWLLGLGDGVEVIKPESLRTQMISNIDKMQDRYRKSVSPAEGS